MFVYYFSDGEVVESEKGLPIKEITKNQIEHGELLVVKELKDEQ